MVDGIPLLDRVEEVCDGCALGKHQRHPFPQLANYRAEKGLDLVHTDLCGQIRPKTPGGKSYFLLIVDDFCRYMWVELLTSKDEPFKCFKRVKALAETECGLKLRTCFVVIAVGSSTPSSSRSIAMSTASSISPRHRTRPSKMASSSARIVPWWRWRHAY